MSYTVLQPQGSALRVQLDTGELIDLAYSVQREDSSNATVVQVHAALVDAQGAVQLDEAMQPVCTQLRFTAAPEFVAAVNLQAITRACMRAVLGEPQEMREDMPDQSVLGLSAEVLAGVSIRHAIAAAAAMLAPPIDHGALL